MRDPVVTPRLDTQAGSPSVDGTREREFTTLMDRADADEDLNRAVSVDSTIVRTHQDAAGPAKGARAQHVNATITPSAGHAVDRP